MNVTGAANQNLVFVQKRKSPHQEWGRMWRFVQSRFHRLFPLPKQKTYRYGPVLIRLCPDTRFPPPRFLQGYEFRRVPAPQLDGFSHSGMMAKQKDPRLQTQVRFPVALPAIIR